MKLYCACGEWIVCSAPDLDDQTEFIIVCKKCDKKYKINKNGYEALSKSDMIRLLLKS